MEHGPWQMAYQSNVVMSNLLGFNVAYSHDNHLIQAMGYGWSFVVYLSRLWDVKSFDFKKFWPTYVYMYIYIYSYIIYICIYTHTHANWNILYIYISYIHKPDWTALNNHHQHVFSFSGSHSASTGSASKSKKMPADKAPSPAEPRAEGKPEVQLVNDYPPVIKPWHWKITVFHGKTPCMSVYYGHVQ